MLGGEVIADNCDYTHLREVTCGERKVGGRSAKNILGPTGRSGDVVKSDGTDREYAHEFLVDRDR